MTTNLDILAFLQAAQEDRAKEKEEDKVTRAKERKEDMEHILSMIQRGVQKEVRAAINPIEERLAVQEKVNRELTVQLNTVLKDMEVLKGKVKPKQNIHPSYQDFPQLSLEPRKQQVMQENWGGARPRSELSRRPEYTVGPSVLDMCSSARKVVGLTPIEPRMLEMQMENYGAKDMEEAKIMEIKSYLKCEMKMRSSDIAKLDFNRIFPPAKENWNVLYVELGSDYQVDMVMSHTRYMVKHDHRVVRWYPRQMYSRYRAVEAIAYDIRKNLKHKTRVKVGRDDIELSTREADSTVWRRQVLPSSLPEFEMAGFGPSMASSPPPGRPRRDQGFGWRDGGGVNEAENVVVEDEVAIEAATANH